MARPPLRPGMAGKISTTERAPKTWVARTRVCDMDGRVRQVTATGTTRNKAELALKDKLLERTTGTQGAYSGDTKYRVLAEHWLDKVQREQAATTHDTYRRWLTATVLPLLGELRVRDITASHIARTLEQMHVRYSSNSVRGIRKVISGPLALAKEWGLIDRNPVADLSPIRGGAAPSRALTDDERSRLLHFVDTDRRAVDNDLGALLRFLLGTGCRISEALGLLWRDVDLEHHTCLISGALVRVSGAGVRRAVTKSRAGHRKVWLPEFVATSLSERWDPRDMTLAQPVFSSATGGWRDPNNIQRVVRYTRGQVDGLGWMTTHTFRRTAATILDDAGLSPREIADQLGHSRPSMSQDVYMARAGQGSRRAAEALGRSMTSTPPAHQSGE